MTSLGALFAIIRKKGLKIGFANGCFDRLHKGHLHLLREAAGLCDVLVVAVNSDDSVAAAKGKGRPLEPLAVRMRALEATNICGVIANFDTEAELLKMIQEARPDFLIKGEDYRGRAITGDDFVRSYGGKVVLIPLLEGYSTTKLLN